MTELPELVSCGQSWYREHQSDENESFSSQLHRRADYHSDTLYAGAIVHIQNLISFKGQACTNSSL